MQECLSNKRGLMLAGIAVLLGVLILWSMPKILLALVCGFLIYLLLRPRSPTT